MWVLFCQTRMAGPRRVTVLLALLGVLLGAGAQKTEVIKVGSEVTMEPKYTGNPSEINWKINGNKLVDMEVTPPNDPKFYRLRDRATIDGTNGRLTIKNLTIGDSGGYRAEVLVNSVYQYTEIRLTVRDCPDVPTITDQSTKDRIVLLCVSSTPDVTYEWQINKIPVGTNRLYNESRPKEEVTLTCFIDNKVCKKNASITIPYTPESSGPSGGVIAGILFGVLIAIAAICAPLYIFRHKLRTIFPFFICCKGKKTTNDEKKRNGTNKPEHEQNLPLIAGGVKGVNVVVEEGNVVDKKVKESDGCGRIALNLPCKGKMRLVKFQKDAGPFIEAEVGEVDGQPKRIVRLSVTIEGVEPADYEDFAAEAHLSNGERRLFPMKGDECDVEEENAAAVVDKKGKDDVIIKCEGDRVRLTVPDTEKVTKLTWMKGGDILFTWEVSGLKLHANNVTLEPGSAIVNNLEPGDSGSYNVEVHSTDRSVTKSTFQVAVFEQVDKSENRRNVKLKVVRKVDLPENGHSESQPIGSITFHPIKMSNKTEITWKKGDQPVNIDGDKMKRGQNGDLTINNATPKDQGEYTVHCDHQELEQEFNLRL